VFWDLTTWFVVFIRFSAYLLLFPITAAQSIPISLRLGFSGVCAFVIMPLVPQVPPGGSLHHWLGLLFLEVSTGLLLGLLARFLFYAVEIAGSLISTETGLMLSSNFNPITSTFGSAPGALLHWFTIALMLSLNLHHWMIIGLQRSYELVPAGTAHLSELLLSNIVGRAAGMFVIALQMTAPILASSFLVTLLFSLLGRAVPQMNVFSESFPVRSIAGLSVFGLTCNLLAQHVLNYLHRIPEDFIRVAQMLGT
jgi:flagellar biosynthesis protein FliR